ncbi:MAG: SURF1 family protein [Longimicrobiales bacterium]
MRTLELTRRGVLGTVAVLVVAGVCIRLGIWQLERRAERQARNALIAERMDAPPVMLERAPMDTAGLAYRRARLAGAVDDDRAIVLAGRSRNGAPGVHVLSPVRLGGGAVLVNRGWLPAPDAATADLGPVRIEGAVQVEGVLVPFPDVDLDTEPDGFRTRWFRVDGSAIRAQYPYPVAPLYLVATARPEPVRSGPGTPGAGMDSARAPGDAVGPVPLEPPTVEPGPHLSYAIQWFSFAAIFLIGWIVLLLRRPGPGDG